MKFRHLNDEHGTVLKVDIDEPNLSWFTVNSLQFISMFYTIQKFIIKSSPSGKGIHIIICLKEELDDAMIIVWQFALGSDKWRERHNLIRLIHRNKMSVWNLLFSKKMSKKFKLEL